MTDSSYWKLRSKWRHTRTGISFANAYVKFPLYLETHTRQRLDAECFAAFWFEVAQACAVRDLMASGVPAWVTALQTGELKPSNAWMFYTVR